MKPNKPNIKDVDKFVADMKCYSCQKSNLTFKKIHSVEGDTAEVEVVCEACGTNHTTPMYFGAVKGTVL